MYLIVEKEVRQEDGTAVTQKKSQHRIFDSRDGLKYFASDAARELADIKDLRWDDILTHVSGIATAYSAPAG